MIKTLTFLSKNATTFGTYLKSSELKVHSILGSEY